MRAYFLPLVLAFAAAPASDAWQSAQASSQTLYLGTADHIYVYTPGAAEPRLVIDKGVINLTQLAVDGAGRRYAASFGATQTYADSAVTQYDRGRTLPALTRTDGIRSASGVAVDALGDVFASSYYGGSVLVFLPGQATPLFTLGGLEAPDLLAVHGWELFVGESGYGKILRLPEFAALHLAAPGPLPPGAITYGGPFVVGEDGSVYAGGAVVAADVGYEEFVNVFAPGADRPSASVVVSMGRGAESAPYLAVGGGHVYASSADAGAVFEYDLARGATPTRAIDAGLNQPGPLAVDAAGNLYVGSVGYVGVYAPGAVTPRQTILIPGGARPVSVLIAK